MKKSGSHGTRIAVVIAIIISMYTLTMPLVQVNPILSGLLGYAEGSNNAAVDGISLIIGTITPFLDSGDGTGSSGTGDMSDIGGVIIKALSDEKEAVSILSKGKCTLYDFGRIFQIIGRYANDETIQTVYLAVGGLFYVICALGVLAILLALYGKYVCAVIYAGSAGLDLYLLSSAVYDVNELLKVNALSIMDARTIIGAGAAVVGLAAFVGIFSEGGKERESVSSSEPSPLPDSGDSRVKRFAGEREAKKASVSETERSGIFGKRSFEKAGYGGSGLKKENRKKIDLWIRMAGAKQKKIYGAVLFAVLLFILGGGIWILIKKATPETIDLSTYINIDIAGYDGYGKASCVFYEEAFLQELEGLLIDRYSGIGENSMSEEDASEIARSIYEKRQTLFSEDKNLSNGDVVYLNVAMNPEAAEILEQHGVKAKFKDAHFVQEVKGLPKVRDYDPFEDIGVSFQGAEPYGEAVLTYMGEYEEIIEIEAKPQDGLRNGDMVEVSVSSEYDDEELIEEYGIRLSGKRKMIEVSGLLYYPERIEDFYNKELSKISENAQGIAKEHISAEFERDEQLTGFFSYGQYFASALAEGSQFHNQMYCVYEVHYANTSGDTQRYYYYVRLENIMIDPKSGEAVVDYGRFAVPQKPSVFSNTLNLSEFVMVRLFPPRILSGFVSLEDFYANYISPLEETCLVSDTF